jgi:hypothetical protein
LYARKAKTLLLLFYQEGTMNTRQNVSPDAIKARLRELGYADAQVRTMSLDILGASKVLDAGESIEYAVQGKLGKTSGLLVATDRRVFFVNQGLIKTQAESFLYTKISSVQYKTGLLRSSIALIVDARTLIIDHVLNDFAVKMADYLRERIERKDEPRAALPDAVSQLERLAKLKEQGVLTDEEFQAQKKKILNM